MPIRAPAQILPQRPDLNGGQQAYIHQARPHHLEQQQRSDGTNSQESAQEYA